MCAQSNRLVVFAETCRSRAAVSCSPFRRDHLLVLAGLSEREAGLVQVSYDCIAATKALIDRAEILLVRR